MGHGTLMTREVKIASIFFAITATLWFLALLFLFRIINIFDAYLMKFTGPVVIWGTLILCPIGMVYLGLKIKKFHQCLWLGRFFMGFGTLFLLAFVTVIGVPKHLSP